MCNHRIITGALCLIAAAPLAQAGPQEDALLQQVKQIASQGQDAQTTAQVNQYVDQNKDAITSILQNYVQYLKQIQDMSGDGAPPAQATVPIAAQPAPTASPAQPPQSQNTVPQPPPAQILETAQAIQTDALQTSGGLQMAHLRGYPALPSAPPVSAVQQPTAEQVNYASSVQKEMQARKAYLMEHPEGYTY